MAESVPVRCPECRREHTYTPPAYPCACGAPVTLPLLHGGLPVRVRHRTWEGSWVEVRCPSCGAAEQWPQPELGCGCGAILRLPVAPPRFRPHPVPSEPHGAGAADGADPAGRPNGTGGTGSTGGASGTSGTSGTGGAYGPAAPGGDGGRERHPTVDPETTGGSGELAAGPEGSGRSSGCEGREPAASGPERRDARPDRATAASGSRPAFSPVTIRTAQDVRTAAAQYLRWLGFADVRAADKHPASGIDLRGPGVVAHVDSTIEPTSPRAVETLWLNALNDSVTAVCFSLAGYTHESRVRADTLTVALFVLDLTGTPQPVNDSADALIG